MWTLFSDLEHDVLFRDLLCRSVAAFLAHFQEVKPMPSFALATVEEPNSPFLLAPKVLRM